MWWYCVWPWPLGQGQIWHQWIPQMWFPIDAQYISYVYVAPIRCYRPLICDGTAYDIDLKVKVNHGITNGFLRCGFLLMFNTFYMSILLQQGATGYWNVMGLHMTLTIRSRSNMASPMDSSDMASYWCSIHFICLSCSNKVLQATEKWWYCVWPWPLGQRQTWNHQWIPQMWFPIDVQCIPWVCLASIRCYRLLKCDGPTYDIDLKVKVKFDINRFLRCGFLLMFKTFCMSLLLE